MAQKSIARHGDVCDITGNIFPVFGGAPTIVSTTIDVKANSKNIAKQGDQTTPHIHITTGGPVVITGVFNNATGKMKVNGQNTLVQGNQAQGFIGPFWICRCKAGPGSPDVTTESI